MPRLEHVGIAVNDVDRTIRVLSDLLGETPYGDEIIQADSVRTHFIWGGSAKLELLEGLHEDSPVRRFIDRRGPGLHHLAFEVENIHAMHARARESGYEPLDPEPRHGADGKLIFFLHPKKTAGVLIEFCQSSVSRLVAVDLPEVDGVSDVSRSPGSRSTPPLVYLFFGKPAVDLRRMAVRLAPNRAFYAVRGGPDVRLRAVLDALSLGNVHAAADGTMVSALLGVEPDGRVRSLTLIDPDSRSVVGGPDIRMPVLVLTPDDDEGLRTAAAVRARYPGASIAVVLDDDARTAVIERHLQTASR